MAPPLCRPRNHLPHFEFLRLYCPALFYQFVLAHLARARGRGDPLQAGVTADRDGLSPTASHFFVGLREKEGQRFFLLLLHLANFLGLLLSRS